MKKVVLILTMILTLCCLTGCGMNVRQKFDKLISSDKLEIIYFERDTQTESSTLKQILDEDLKNEGINYNVINLDNVSNEDIEYMYDKLNLKNYRTENGVLEFNDVLLVAVKDYNPQADFSPKLLISKYDIKENYEETKLQIKYEFAQKDLLNNNEEIKKEYNYSLGKKALDEGYLNVANRYLKNLKGYKDVDDLLKDKRFNLLKGYEFRSDDAKFSFSMQIIEEFDTNSLEYVDKLYISKLDCQGYSLTSCYIYTSQFMTFEYYKARVIENRIEFMSNNSDKFDKCYEIESITDTELKLKNINFTLKIQNR